MKYRDLVSFEPLETVKELRRADDRAQALEDVKTYVISDRMADQLNNLIIPNLQFETPADNKGLLIVANYGTGKTHLMSTISAIAEHADLVDELTNDSVKHASGPIAGKFKVIRAEIGATGIPELRGVIVDQLERGLKNLGVDFKFPDVATQTNSKDALEAMMQAFECKYPDQGLLFVLDELLDYLRTRPDAELIQSLVFLREIGEISPTTRFRFIAGIQEAIFDNPRFSHAAENVRRVRDRFEQTRIDREDIEFVVQERLLKKSVGQRDQIRDHLQEYTSLYEGMAENLEQYVQLFPVHPSYVQTFQRISVVEKRTILRTLSREISQRLDMDVPEDEPGLICFDSYHRTLAEDPSNRTEERISEVLDRAEKLGNVIRQSMVAPQYSDTALRIIDALAVHRLTTEDNSVPIGLTVENLRDDLTLLPPGLPKKDALFLSTTIQTVIGHILTTVSGQYISKNEESAQYYLDVHKDIDYDARIEERAQHLDKERLDSAYYQAVEELLELRDAPYVSGYRIWQYELPWSEKNVTRTGYLFMGAPNQRSTAQPPRDFYVYFLQPFEELKFEDAKRDDEVFIRLAKRDDVFDADLRRYAGAAALERESGGTSHRGIYADKRRVALERMIDWLRQNIATAISVKYQGVSKTIPEWLGAGQATSADLHESVIGVASSVLSNHFESRYPGYPAFEVTVTNSNLSETVRMALAQITGRQATLGKQALEALGLLDSNGAISTDANFAAHLREQLKSANGKVLNRSDLLVQRDRGLEFWGSWFLEPVWLIVVAAALVQRGQAEIQFGNKRIDALTTDQLVSMSVDDLEGFTQIAPPRATPVNTLREVAAIYNVNPQSIGESGLNDETLSALLQSVGVAYDQAIVARDAIAERTLLWGEVIFDQPDERAKRLGSFIDLIEDLRGRNSIGKMNRFSAASERLAAATEGKAELESITAILKAKDRLTEQAEYLMKASEFFGFGFELSIEAEDLKDEVLDIVRIGNEVDQQKIVDLSNRCDQLKSSFAEAAERSYRHAHLDAQGDQRKRALLEGSEFNLLRSLSVVEILPGDALTRIQQRLVELRPLMNLDATKFKDSVIYPDKSDFKPGPLEGMSAHARLEDIEKQVNQLVKDWEGTLVDNLSAPDLDEEIGLLDSSEESAVRMIIESKILPEAIDDSTIQAINKVFTKFEKRNLSRSDLWHAIFPDQAPTTVDEFEARVAMLSKSLGSGAPNAERIRIVPQDGDSTS